VRDAAWDAEQVGKIFGLHMHGFGRRGAVFNASILAANERASHAKLLRLAVDADATGAAARAWKAARDATMLFPPAFKGAWRDV